MLPLPVSGLVAVAVLKQAVLIRARASWDMVHVGVAASGQRACQVSGNGGVARPISESRILEVGTHKLSPEACGVAERFEPTQKVG
jgi:hypothetical protein